MPAPLIWLGAAVIGAYAANEANTAYLKKTKVVDAMPGHSKDVSVPVNGSIVTCGIYGVLNHTGIWVDGNIYELSGKGLVRCLSPNRFLGDRSGSEIYVACDAFNNVLTSSSATQRSREMLYSVLNYHLFNENCHRFVARVIAGKEIDITSFSALNTFMSDFFATPIRWNLTEINIR